MSSSNAGAASAIPRPIKRFWTRFLKATGRDPRTRFVDILYFADNEAQARAIASLVVSGRKTATSALQWEYDVEGVPVPRPGDLSIVATWNEVPVCVIETTDVAIAPFEMVDAEFAACEGEGDGSLEAWRRSHWAYFERVCGQIGRACSPRMPVVCQRFKLVFEQRGG